MTQNISWSRILIEGAAIVVSILLAFGIDAWWEARSDQSRTEQLLQALEAEWSSELNVIGNVLDQIRTAHGAMTELIEIGRLSQSALNEDAALRAYTNAYFSTYKPTMGALNSLLQSDLDNVTSPELRTAIASWPGVLDEIAPEQAALHELNLLGWRRVNSRIAQQVQLSSPQSAADYELSYGVLRNELALAVVRDEEWKVVATHVMSVLDSYTKQLAAIRGRLEDNLLLLTDR